MSHVGNGEKGPEVAYHLAGQGRLALIIKNDHILADTNDSCHVNHVQVLVNGLTLQICLGTRRMWCTSPLRMATSSRSKEKLELFF